MKNILLSLHTETEGALEFLGKRVAPLLKLSRNALINNIIMQYAVHRGYKVPAATGDSPVEK